MKRKKKYENVTILDISYDIIKLMFTYLSLFDLTKCRRIDRTFNDIIKNEIHGVDQVVLGKKANPSQQWVRVAFNQLFFSNLLSNFTGLHTLTVMGESSATQHIIGQQCGITLPKIKSLTFSDCYIPLRSAQQIFDTFPNLQELKYLSCRFNSLKTMIYVVQLSSSKLLSFSLGHSFFDEVDDTEIPSTLPLKVPNPSQTLDSLVLSGIISKIERFKTIIPKTLTSLDISQSKDVSSDFILFLSNHCTNLQKINVSSCTNIETHALLQMVERLPQLNEIDISQLSSVTDQILESITTSVGSQLENVNIKGCMHLSHGAIVNLIKVTFQLKQFSASGSRQITDDIIFLLLSFCKQLTHLSISNSSIGGERVAEYVAKNPKLKLLSVTSHELKESEYLMLRSIFPNTTFQYRWQNPSDHLTLRRTMLQRLKNYSSSQVDINDSTLLMRIESDAYRNSKTISEYKNLDIAKRFQAWLDESNPSRISKSSIWINCTKNT